VPFSSLDVGSGFEEVFFFFEPELLRAVGRVFVGFGFRFCGRLVLDDFFDAGRAPRRACFLE
jgi:hypothetical protein